MAIEIDYNNPPKRSLEELLLIFNEKTFLIMDDALSSNRVFKVTFQNLLDILKHGFEKEEIRKRPMKFKFHKDDRKIYEMEIRHLLSNLILWKPFIDIDKVELLNESYIYDFTQFNINTLIDYINTKILPVHDGDFASKNEAVDEIGYMITAIAHAFCPLFGVSISIHNLIAFEKRCPEVGQIIRQDIPTDLQLHEVEDLLNVQTNRLIHLIEQDPYNDLRPLFLAGKNVSAMQFREFMIHIGYKPDINGNTIPIFIQDNFLITGLTKPSSLYINASGGRKALIMTKLAMGTPGYFTKKANSACTTAGILRQDEEMCDSNATVDYLIKDDLFLKMLNGRYYYDAMGKLCYLDYNKDKQLIGKIVRFRSPITCSSDDGGTICKYCYGHMYEINKEMASVGALAA